MFLKLVHCDCLHCTWQQITWKHINSLSSSLAPLCDQQFKLALIRIIKMLRNGFSHHCKQSPLHFGYSLIKSQLYNQLSFKKGSASLAMQLTNNWPMALCLLVCDWLSVCVWVFVCAHSSQSLSNSKANFITFFNHIELIRTLKKGKLEKVLASHTHTHASFQALTRICIWTCWIIENLMAKTMTWFESNVVFRQRNCF